MLATEGVFDYDPLLDDLQVSRYTDDFLDDDFNQTAWTLKGSVGDLDIVIPVPSSIAMLRQYRLHGLPVIGAFISGYQCSVGWRFLQWPLDWLQHGL